MEQKDQLPRSFAETAQKIELGGSLVPGVGAGSATPREGAAQTRLGGHLVERSYRSARALRSSAPAGWRARPDQGSSSAADRSVRAAPFNTGFFFSLLQPPLLEGNRARGGRRK